jgi:hypothetical protein
MQGKIALVLGVVLSVQAAWAADPMQRMLAKLSPQERSHQACILRGLDTVRRDARLRKADRMKTSIFSPAVLDGTHLTAKGGAVRDGSRWFAISFSCQLTADLMKATSFSFTLGNEVPKDSWDRLGPWQ